MQGRDRETAILLADDHNLVRETLAQLIVKSAEQTKVLQAHDFGAVLKIAATTPLDLAILDYVMPGMRGLKGLLQLRENYPRLPVVILSGVVQPSLINQALHHGAAGFIPKTISGKAFLDALQLVLDGERYIPAQALDNAPQEGISAGCLTRREKQTLECLAEGYCNRDIANHLQIREVTVKAHLRSLFNKLGVSNRVEAALWARDHKEKTGL